MLKCKLSFFGSLEIILLREDENQANARTNANVLFVSLLGKCFLGFRI